MKQTFSNIRIEARASEDYATTLQNYICFYMGEEGWTPNPKGINVSDEYINTLVGEWVATAKPEDGYIIGFTVENEDEFITICGHIDELGTIQISRLNY